MDLTGISRNNKNFEIVVGTTSIPNCSSSTPTPTKISRITSTRYPTLSTIKTASSTGKVPKTLSPLIVKRLSLIKANLKKLQVHLRVYFNTKCIINKSILGMMIKHASWELLEFLYTTKQEIYQLKVPITLLLAKLVIYMVLL